MANALSFDGHAAQRLHRSRTGNGWARTGQGVIFVLLLFILLVQGTLVQTHVHFSERASSPVAVSVDRHAQVSRQSTGDSPVDCPLCQEAAMAGAYTLPPVLVLPSPPAPVLWSAGAVLAGFGLVAPAHAWRSRAPPQ